MGYILIDNNNQNINILTTTRNDGFSLPPYDAFNMSYDVGDNPENVLKNRNKLTEELKILPYNLIIPKQHHGDKILKITNITDDREADALYTYNKDLALSILHSDCAPIFLYAKDKEIICAIHASIKGTYLEIVKKVINVLVKKEYVDPKNIYAYFGPGVTFSHINATQEMLDKAIKLGYQNALKKSMNQAYVDINFMNFIQLRDMGVPIDNITLSKYDTYDNANLFFSSMRNNITGRMISIIRFNK